MRLRRHYNPVSGALMPLRGQKCARVISGGFSAAFDGPETKTAGRFRDQLPFPFAEEGGFEPPIPREGYTGFRDQRLQPLGHPSFWDCKDIQKLFKFKGNRTANVCGGGADLDVEAAGLGDPLVPGSVEEAEGVLVELDRDGPGLAGLEEDLGEARELLDRAVD